jgi:hypothetical protein
MGCLLLISTCCLHHSTRFHLLTLSFPLTNQPTNQPTNVNQPTNRPQILNNLLSNAAKFTHHGTISVAARCHDAAGQWVVVHVRDSGIGIPRHKMQSIFLPFEQVGLVASVVPAVFFVARWRTCVGCVGCVGCIGCAAITTPLHSCACP